MWWESHMHTSEQSDLALLEICLFGLFFSLTAPTLSYPSAMDLDWADLREIAFFLLHRKNQEMYYVALEQIIKNQQGACGGLWRAKEGGKKKNQHSLYKTAGKFCNRLFSSLIELCFIATVIKLVEYGGFEFVYPFYRGLFNPLHTNSSEMPWNCSKLSCQQKYHTWHTGPEMVPIPSSVSTHFGCFFSKDEHLFSWLRWEQKPRAG